MIKILRAFPCVSQAHLIMACGITAMLVKLESKILQNSIYKS